MAGGIKGKGGEGEAHPHTCDGSTWGCVNPMEPTHFEQWRAL